MPNHDRLFKELLRVFFIEFIMLFWPKLAAAMDRNSIEFLQQEIFTDVTAGDCHEADLLVKARLEGIGPMVFQVEAQGTPQAVFPERMFSYFSRVLFTHQVPVFPVGLLTYDSPRERAPNEYEVKIGDHAVLKFQYETVQLNLLDWRDYVGSGNPVGYALMSKMRMKPEERKLVKLECLRSTLSLGMDEARTELIAGFVNTYLRLKPEEEQWVVQELKISNPEQPLFWTYWHEKGLEQGLEKGLEQGLEKGREQGLEQGLEQGRGQGMAAIAELVLKRRLGDLPESTMRLIRSLPPERIADLTECARDLPTAASLDQWLARNSGPSAS